MDWLQFLQIVCVPAFIWLVYKFGEIRKELSDFKVQVAREYPVLWDQGQYDLRELTKKYFVDLSSQPQWYDMDEDSYESVTRKYK